MSSLTELKELILESIRLSPCTENQLYKRDFLYRKSRSGIDILVHDLIKQGKIFEKEKGDEFFLSTYDSLLDVEDLKVGNIYKGKRRTKTYSDFGEHVYNDRRIISVNIHGVQYDSPSIRVGQARPHIDTNEFLHWLKSDVTDETRNSWVVVK
jgi:hypothetical protein